MSMTRRVPGHDPRPRPTPAPDTQAGFRAVRAAVNARARTAAARIAGARRSVIVRRSEDIV